MYGVVAFWLTCDLTKRFDTFIGTKRLQAAKRLFAIIANRYMITALPDSERINRLADYEVTKMQYQVFKCAWCGEHLLSSTEGRQTRSDKRFCSAKCRGRYNRWLVNLVKRQERAIKEIAEIAEYLQHPMAQQRAVQALVTIREMIDRHAAFNGLKEVG